MRQSLPGAGIPCIVAEPLQLNRVGFAKPNAKPSSSAIGAGLIESLISTRFGLSAIPSKVTLINLARLPLLTCAGGRIPFEGLAAKVSAACSSLLEGSE